MWFAVVASRGTHRTDAAAVYGKAVESFVQLLPQGSEGHQQRTQRRNVGEHAATANSSGADAASSSFLPLIAMMLPKFTSIS